MIKNCNDGSQNDPYLRLDLNYWNCADLPYFSKGPVRASDLEKHQAISDAGYIGVQDGDPALCEHVGLRFTGQHRVNVVGDLDEKIHEWVSGAYDCASIHVGWGMESDDERDRLVDYVLQTSSRHNFPIYIETHRATITQDIQRTVSMIEKFPEVRFNGDFSHWYTGLEMVNGDLETKWSFIQPVFDRVRFIHGRIGNPGNIQVDIGDGKNRAFVDHFKEMWIRSFKGFLKSAQPGDFLCFTPELLPTEFYYARLLSTADANVEEGDRWTQALLYCDLAKECWKKAKARI